MLLNTYNRFIFYVFSTYFYLLKKIIFVYFYNEFLYMNIFKYNFFTSLFKPKIVHKLVMLILTLLLITTLFLSLLYYNSTKNALIQRTIYQLESVKILKKGWINDYFENEKNKFNSIISIYIRLIKSHTIQK